jgi:hypothetical protein
LVTVAFFVTGGRPPVAGTFTGSSSEVTASASETAEVAGAVEAAGDAEAAGAAGRVFDSTLSYGSAATFILYLIIYFFTEREYVYCLSLPI